MFAILLMSAVYGSVRGCPVGGSMLTLMFSRAAMVLWASSSSELSCDTRFCRYFLSLLRLSDCTHIHIVTHAAG